MLVSIGGTTSIYEWFSRAHVWQVSGIVTLVALVSVAVESSH